MFSPTGTCGDEVFGVCERRKMRRGGGRGRFDADKGYKGYVC